MRGAYNSFQKDDCRSHPLDPQHLYRLGVCASAIRRSQHSDSSLNRWSHFIVVEACFMCALCVLERLTRMCTPSDYQYLSGDQAKGFERGVDT